MVETRENVGAGKLYVRRKLASFRAIGETTAMTGDRHHSTFARENKRGDMSKASGHSLFSRALSHTFLLLKSMDEHALKNGCDLVK
jgi:hypothetical protein